jgi:HAD superfamily hydrolase (TIGR01549 family)
MRTIDTVLFDLDDTLHDDTAAYETAVRRVAADLARSHGIDAEVVFDAYRAEAQKFWKELERDHLGTGIVEARERMWTIALAAAGLHDPALMRQCAQEYLHHRAAVLELSPGALDLVHALKTHGCKLGIVTNGFAATHHDKIARLGLTPHFDALFLADEMGMVKPDPRVFRHAMTVLGSVAERTAMVGDRYDRDIVGAHTLGIFTVLIDVHAIPIPAAGPRPDAVVATIAEVLDVLPLRTGTRSVGQRAEPL